MKSTLKSYESAFVVELKKKKRKKRKEQQIRNKIGEEDKIGTKSK